MGLGDSYTNIPQSFAGQSNGQMGDAFSSLPALERSKLQADSQRQQNADAEYNAPGRAANSHEQGIGSYVQSLFGGVPPEFVERFHQDRKTLNQPMPPQANGTYTGPMTSQEAPTPMSGMSAPAAVGGYGLPNIPQEYPTSDQIQGGLSSNPRMGQQSMTTKRPDASSMTNGDVSKYMSMAPFIANQSKERIALGKPQRDYLGEIALRATMKGDQDRTTEGTKQGNRVVNQDDKQENDTKMQARELKVRWDIALLKNDRDLERIEASIRRGGMDAMAIAQLKAQVEIMKANIAAGAKELSSLPGLVDDPKVKADKEAQEVRIKQAEVNIARMTSQPTKPTGTESGSSSQTKSSSSSDAAALRWARANKSDPRAAAIFRKNGVTE